MRFLKDRIYKGSRDERSLLAAYKQTGELEVLGHLYEPYMPLVYGLCLKYLQQEERSKDAVMQIFEQLVAKLRVHEVGNFKSWLFTLSRNYCLMELRALGKHPEIPLNEDVENVAFEHLTETDENESTLRLMETCMKKLPEAQRTAVKLFYLEEKCYKEIAALMASDLNKVKSYIQNGKRNLKIYMEKEQDHE